MSVRAAADNSYENLKKALAEGRLPVNVADTAVKLCERLHEPVRVSVMGLPGSGKSAVVNLLLNKIVVPEGVRLPTTQFVKGDTPRAVCTMADGSSRPVENTDSHEIAGLEPIFVEFQMPLPALGRISVLEVVAPDAPKDQQRAMHWAAKRTDIALWCTQGFTSIEQALWASLPEKVKDHAMMLVTRADLLEQQGTLDQTVEEIRFGSAHEFNKIMPIATTDAIAARRADGSTDKPLLQKSGGLTLISSILRQVDQGLQATVDQADLILHKFKDATPNPDAVRHVEKAKAPRPITKPVLNEEATQLIDDFANRPVVEVVSSQPVATGTSKPIEAVDTLADDAPADDARGEDAFVLRGKSAVYNPAPPESEMDTAPETGADTPEEADSSSVQPTRVKSKPITTARPKSEPLKIGRPVAPVSAADPDAPKKPRVGFMPKAKTTIIAPRAKPETCAAYNEAVIYLAEQGRALTKQMSEAEDLSSDDLVSASADNITWLTDYLDGVDVADDPVLEKSRTRALDATELVQLMQFEKNENAGIEALTLVVQLKRDLEAEIALSRSEASVKAA